MGPGGTLATFPCQPRGVRGLVCVFRPLGPGVSLAPELFLCWQKTHGDSQWLSIFKNDNFEGVCKDLQMHLFGDVPA